MYRTASLDKSRRVIGQPTAALGILLLLGACAQTAPHTPAAERVVRYVCERGETLEVRYRSMPDTAVLHYHAERFELPIQPSGSGFAYGDGRHNLRGKGDALTLEVGRMMPLQCMAQP